MITPMAPFEFRSHRSQLLDFKACRAIGPEEVVRLLGRDCLVWLAVVFECVFDLPVRHVGDKQTIIDATVEAHRWKDRRHALVQLP